MCVIPVYIITPYDMERVVQQTNKQTNKQKENNNGKKVRNTGKKANQNPEIEVMK